MGCAPASPGRATLSLKSVSNPKADSMLWSWRGGTVLPGDLGDPTGTTDYLLCIYDNSGASQPRLALAAPHDGLCRGIPCWSGASPKFRYKDQLLSPDGLRDGSIDASSSSAEKFTGKGGHLFANVTSPPPFPFTFPMTVQLVNSTGFCWDSTFSTGVQTTTILKAQSD